MQAGALQALEFDRIVTLVTNLAVTPPGRDRLADLHPLTDPTVVAAAQRATSEGVRFLTEQSAFPLRAPEDLLDVLGALGVAGRALEPLRLLALADYLDSIARTRAAIASVGETYPVLQAMAGGAASFTAEIAGIRRTIEPSGDMADHASPALAGLRTRLRRQRGRLRTTLEGPRARA
jgi:DNA mismatch repair protein MutS2